MITTCDTCKKTIERQDSWMRGKRHFCDKKCHIKFQSTLRGEQTNNWRGGPLKLNCNVCSRPFERKWSSSQNPKYCSLKCAGKATSLSGEKNPNWKGRYDTRYLRKNAPRPKPLNCEVCQALGSNFKKGLQYDHCHKSNKFRGWLCTNCNTALGLVKDNPETLKGLIKYLEVNENLL